MSNATPLVVPQVNVNDDSVLLVRWAVAPNATVAAGDHVCDVETTKAVSEVTAHAAGVLMQVAEVGTRVAVGRMLGVIASTPQEAAAYLAAESAQATRATSSVTATPKATALAEQLGVSLAAVAASGVQGTIKETDVRRFHASAPSTVPAALAPYLDRVGDVPAFDAAVSGSLRRSTSSLILTSVDMECGLPAARQVIRNAAAGGKMVSLLHLVIGAAARALPSFDRLTMLVHGDQLFRYRSTDVAFVARAADGRLFTPVIRRANEKSLEQIAAEAQALTMNALRGRSRAEDLSGAAFTISQVPVPGTSRVVALPSFGQSAILGVSAERTVVDLNTEGAAVLKPVVTLTLNYDHALCDGMYAANFLAAMVKDLESGAQ
ncbi:MAG TPA: 2-oxo acid dehydrogenase subunit E2 [Vicinamibacterales bacterium]|nr:2-oxo acid dehydrogenase subunit E2 [Vicinamibacterales bacterium]